MRRVCLTPGAEFHIHVADRAVRVAVDLPMALGLAEPEARVLEDELHDAAEGVLAKYFKRGPFV